MTSPLDPHRWRDAATITTPRGDAVRTSVQWVDRVPVTRLETSVGCGEMTTRRASYLVQGVVFSTEREAADYAAYLLGAMAAQERGAAEALAGQGGEA